jgi:hypothetical protein
MPHKANFLPGSPELLISDAAFPLRKAAPPVPPPSYGIGNLRHDYRITVDVLNPGGEETESVSFFASTEDDLFAEVDRLRRQGHKAAHALTLAVGLSLLKEASALQPAPASVIPIES